MTTENVKPEKKDDKGKEEEKRGLGKALKKYAPLAMKSAVATLATTAVLAAGCMSDDKKTSDDTNTADATEVVDDTDAVSDVPEDVLDAVEDTEESDVNDRDGPVRLDSIDEDPRPDTVEEDTVEDPSEEDAPVDSSADTGSDSITDTGSDEVVSGTCGPVAAIDTVFVRPGETVTVGNVTVEYVGLVGSNGRYGISCGSVIETVDISEGSTCPPIDVGGGYSIEIRANTARSHGSNITVEVSVSP